MTKNYIFNKETQKIELPLTKEEYNDLSQELKREVKGAFLFSGKAQAWVSRSTKNHYRAIRVAKLLGFENEEVKGKMLSFTEEIDRKIEKAELRQERYIELADGAVKKAEGLQNEFNSFRGDIAFLTQPIIRGHKGSESFGKQRERIMNRYTKGLDEYRKSEYFRSKAEDMKNIINGEKFKNRVYLNNRINECKKNIKVYEKNITWAENNNLNKVSYWLEKLEYEVDKLAFMENALDKIGGIKFSKDDLKPGYYVLIREIWSEILKLNKKTVEVQPLQSNLKCFILKYEYGEISEMKIPKGFKEKEEIKNPYNVGDIVVATSYAGSRIMYAYQVIKVTLKCVVIKEIEVQENKPLNNKFKVNAKESRRQVKKNKYDGNLYITDDHYVLTKY
ncbi:MAG: DUF3560 domain-containing protein [Terrisporobacter othiniensis]|uniref:DUF3560 domain-containing protein n=1 Tax=Terrisporobacter othiniensis TaxID=1577792 RepID=UPI002A749E9A|nr:DUF3560 domain-containing protein [Terrisporobacter othiniensis]MDY3372975.1 DUF3560 domain-containing protein [Terrisporobacter othiniensis]